MSEPTWTTVSTALIVGLVVGQALGFVYAMILEQRLNKWERDIDKWQRDIEALERKMEKNKESTP